jgi:hypothetical protein
MQSRSKPRTKPVTHSATSPVSGKTCAEPAHVVADPDLSSREKILVLTSLEQDARQLSIATAEGMSGGEETNLRGVLQAKRMIESPSSEAAFTVVQQTFEAQLQNTIGTEAHTLITRAIDAIKAAREAIAERMKTQAPASTSELEEELAKEKLDP